MIAIPVIRFLQSIWSWKEYKNKEPTKEINNWIYSCRKWAKFEILSFDRIEVASYDFDWNQSLVIDDLPSASILTVDAVKQSLLPFVRVVFDLSVLVWWSEKQVYEWKTRSHRNPCLCCQFPFNPRSSSERGDLLF